jgi:hypothetical protein
MSKGEFMKSQNRNDCFYITGYARGWQEALNEIKDGCAVRPSETEDIYSALIDYYEETLIPLAMTLGNCSPAADPIPPLGVFLPLAPVPPRHDFMPKGVDPRDRELRDF